ncbi:B-type cyclin CLB3 KNAG_0C03860 [Huiozyma naganishii CBS 8797]|uniref:Uncharacterized protein n=1 Tax=Huiozyma naganishii (strain ATCC MYA-139 / BCRC 22969 / CBS 8797 / KCTC 17520 / NBRC 10181 / NCYC 3082 / Yp74L-3) TaxID=1071383 RepID=J7R3U3_HUIN7|nr:hypothetical protein KNAG_0C03860 [Kazachstania naganishii CBS 8797]CCK69490.1 hypothetical protein KNAG_0C03860 [Kazachstania naganishii CBS 8797]
MNSIIGSQQGRYERIDKENTAPQEYSNNSKSTVSLLSGTNDGIHIPKHRSVLSDVTSQIENKQSTNLNNKPQTGNASALNNGTTYSNPGTNNHQSTIIETLTSSPSLSTSSSIINASVVREKHHFPSDTVSVEDDFEDNDSYKNDVNEYSPIEEDDNNNYLKEPLEPKIDASIQATLDESYKKYDRSTPDPMDEDTYDIVMVAELSNDIFAYLRKLELKFRPNPNYMHYQRHLKWSYRRILLDWLVEVHNRFQLLPETLYLTVNLIDRLLSKKSVLLDRFQVVGAAALFIAAKYEEINCPTLKEIVYMLNGTYTKEDIIAAETYIIDSLGFEIGFPGPMSFLRRISKADDYEYDVRTLAKYLLESTIMDSRLVSAVPSWLAASAYFLSKVILGYTTWSQKHTYYSGYTQQQILPLASIILDNCKDATAHHRVIYEKYSHRRYGNCSQIVARWIEATERKITKKDTLVNEGDRTR